MKNFRKTLAHLWADVQACQNSPGYTGSVNYSTGETKSIRIQIIHLKESGINVQQTNEEFMLEEEQSRCTWCDKEYDDPTNLNRHKEVYSWEFLDCGECLSFQEDESLRPTKMCLYSYHLCISSSTVFEFLIVAITIRRITPVFSDPSYSLLVNCRRSTEPIITK